jgi:voltage-gated potassium channel
MNTATTNLRAMTHGLLEGQPGGYPGQRITGHFIVALIIANGIAVILESNEDLYAAYAPWFAAFEVFSVLVFTLEYLGRLWIAPDRPEASHLDPIAARLRYALKPIALVDLLAIAPFYLSLLIPLDLRYLRLFRLLRLLKLAHYFDGLAVFAAVLRRESSAIAGALLIMLVIIIVSACLMFTVENAAQPGRFDSVAQAIWWAVVTLTTVGYGDITPVTYGGKLLGIVIMLLGVGTMALPAGILAARFSEELQSRRELLRGKVRDALEDGTLDPAEQRSLHKLQDELGLSREELDRIIQVQGQLMQRHNFCPHCGEFIGRER